MCRKFVYVLSVFAVLAMASTGMAEGTHNFWTDANASNHDYNTPDNWSLGVVPDGYNQCALVVPVNDWNEPCAPPDDPCDPCDANVIYNSPDPNGCVFSAGMVHSVGQNFELGRYDTRTTGIGPGNGAAFYMSGGSLDVSNNMSNTRYAGEWGHFFMTGGTINVGYSFRCGWKGGGLTWMTGGEIHLGRDLLIPESKEGSYPIWGTHFQFDGGLIEVGRNFYFEDPQWGTKCVTDHTMDIAGGTLSWDGDNRGAIAEYIADGNLSFYDSNDPRSSIVTYDADEDKTIMIGVAPENVDWGAAYSGKPLGSGIDYDYPDGFSWVSGNYGGTEDLYLSTEFNDVNNKEAGAKFAGVTSPVSISDVNADFLELSTDYYWAIDTTDPNTDTHLSAVFGFTTRSSIYVDHFEDYTDTANLQGTWTGATALVNDANLTDGDTQSMQLDYTDSSEAYRSFATDEKSDFTRKGVESLRVRYFGDNDNSGVEPVYVKLTDKQANSYTIYSTADPNYMRMAGWSSLNVDLGAFEANGVNTAAIDTLAIGVGDGVAPAGSGTIYIDSINLFPPRCVSDKDQPDGDIANNNCEVDIEDLDALTEDWLEKGYTVTKSDAPDADNRWKFEVEDAGTVYDSCDTNNGTMYDFVGHSRVPGKVGKGLAFDGYKDIMVVIDDGAKIFYFGDPLQGGNVAGTTWAAWFKTDSWNAQVIMSICNMDPDEDLNPTGPPTDVRGGHTIYLLRDGTLKFYGRGHEDPPETEMRLNDGQWHHVAVTGEFNTGGLAGDWDTVKIYVDGILVSMRDDADIEGNNFAVSPFSGAQLRLVFGAQIFEEPGRDTFTKGVGFDGILDEVYVFDYQTLSHEEVLDLALEASVNQPVLGDADIVDDESVDLKDFAVMAADWLADQILWP